jgi:hypothetical protein
MFSRASVACDYNDLKGLPRWNRAERALADGSFPMESDAARQNASAGT